MSVIKSNAQQLGQSPTATNNFTLTAEAANGTMKLARGNAGATTQDVMTVDSQGRVRMPLSFEAFQAQLTTLTVAANTLTQFRPTTIVTNINNTYNSTNGRFTPTIPGYYLVSMNAQVTVNAGTTTDCFIMKNGSTLAQSVAKSPGVSGTAIVGTAVSKLVLMNGTTDFIEFHIKSNQNTVFGGSGGDVQIQHSYAEAHLVMAT